MRSSVFSFSISRSKALIEVKQPRSGTKFRIKLVCLFGRDARRDSGLRRIPSSCGGGEAAGRTIQ
jgi:hypothetical protein